jgi:hypothetical protein
MLCKIECPRSSKASIESVVFFGVAVFNGLLDRREWESKVVVGEGCEGVSIEGGEKEGEA